jgi:hypothetical protein
MNGDDLNCRENSSNRLNRPQKNGHGSQIHEKSCCPLDFAK